MTNLSYLHFNPSLKKKFPDPLPILIKIYLINNKFILIIFKNYKPITVWTILKLLPWIIVNNNNRIWISLLRGTIGRWYLKIKILIKKYYKKIQVNWIWINSVHWIIFFPKKVVLFFIIVQFLVIILLGMLGITYKIFLGRGRLRAKTLTTCWKVTCLWKRVQEITITKTIITKFTKKSIPI